MVPQGLSPMRQAIARRMSLSKMTAPHYYVTVEIDMTRAMGLRQELNTELPEDERISVNDMIIKAVASTLTRHPHFNVTVLPEGLRPNATDDVSVAVAMASVSGPRRATSPRRSTGASAMAGSRKVASATEPDGEKKMPSLERYAATAASTRAKGTPSPLRKTPEA